MSNIPYPKPLLGSQGDIIALAQPDEPYAKKYGFQKISGNTGFTVYNVTRRCGSSKTTLISMSYEMKL